MQATLPLKISVWLIIIGAAGLLAPSPAWPQWVSSMLLTAGLALGLTAIATRRWKRRSGHPQDKTQRNP